MPAVPVNGTSIFYGEAGIGFTLLALHGGLGVDHQYMLRALGDFGTTFHVVAPDHRGNGRSGRPEPESFTMAQFGRDLEAIRLAMGGEQVVVLGHSFGGFIALQYALDFPDNVSGLVLVDTAAAWDYADEITANIVARNPSPEMVEELLRETRSDKEFEANMIATTPFYFHRDGPGPGDQFEGTIYSHYGYTHGNVASASYNVRERLGEIRKPHAHRLRPGRFRHAGAAVRAVARRNPGLGASDPRELRTLPLLRGA